MARLGPLVVSALLALAAVLLLAGPAGATHDPKHPAAGNWRMHFPKTPGRADTGVLHLMAVDEAAARSAAAQLQWGSWALGGTGCGPRATAFAVGTFARDSDKGPVVGCFSPTSGIFYGVFKSTQYKVEGGLSGTLPGPMVAGVFPAQPRDELTTTFIGHFPGDGATKEAQACRRVSALGASPACLTLGYEMKPRYGEKTPRGYAVRRVLDEDAPFREVHPSSWEVEVMVRNCRTPARFAWKVDGRTAAVDRTGQCTFRFEFPREDVYQLTVEATYLDGSGDTAAGALEVTVQDWLIVGLGDSLGSGEGAPVGPPGKRGQFDSKRCDRSSNSWQSQVALDIEHNGPAADESSVTFIHLSCSGASIVRGLLGGYEGINPTGSDLPSQVSVLRRLVTSREIDAVLLSAGVNEFRFGAAAKFCGEAELCMDKPFADGLTLRQFVNKIFNVRVAPDPNHRPLADRYRQLREALPTGVGPRVYISEYPDSLNAGRCQALRDAVPVVPLARLDSSESAFLFNDLLVPLNKLISTVAGEFDWNVIRIQNLFSPHGYCAGDDRWIVTYTDSGKRQGDSNGTLHPNETGHEQIAKRARDLVRKDFYPSGKTRAPR
jgi:hypothetical protein